MSAPSGGSGGARTVGFCKSATDCVGSPPLRFVYPENGDGLGLEKVNVRNINEFQLPSLSLFFFFICITTRTPWLVDVVPGPLRSARQRMRKSLGQRSLGYGVVSYHNRTAKMLTNGPRHCRTLTGLGGRKDICCA